MNNSNSSSSVAISSLSCSTSSELVKPPSNHASLIVRLPDSVAYCSLLADTCTFNRGLIRRRTKRLPFLDLATQASQKPAPWLYRTQCERLEGFLNSGTHVFLRYLRHRWRLSNQPTSLKRKLAAQRLWLTLQNAITSLDISAELLPLIIKRAYDITGLPIPSNLLNSLDAAAQRPSAPSCCPITSTQLQSNGSPSTSSASGSMFLGRIQQQQQCMFKKSDLGVVVGGADEDDGSVCEFHDLLTGQKSFRNRPMDISTPIPSGEESLPSSDAYSVKRISTTIEDSDQKPDDDLSMLSSVSLRVTARHRFEINGYTGRSHKLCNSEADEDMLEDESDDEDDDEYGTDSNDVDDVEWLRYRGRKRRGVVGNARLFRMGRRHQGFTGRRTTRAMSGIGCRYSTQRMTKRQRRQKSRRGSYLPESGGSRSNHRLKAIRSATTEHNSIPSQLFVGSDKERAMKDEWDEWDVPGFQPNASLDILSQQNDPSVMAQISFPDSFGTCSSSSAAMHSVNLAAPVIQSFLDNSSNHSTHVLRPPPATLPSSSRPVWSDAKRLSNEVINHESANALPSRSTFLQPLSSGSVSTSAVTTVQVACNPPHNYHDMMVPDENEKPDPVHILTPSRITASSATACLGNPAAKDASGDVQNAGWPGRSPTMHVVGGCSSSGLDKSTPQAATTTVTFFVCEVCSSRYRSTAGLRYHYHSQHSGYTPKNPISASASRQVVPIGEERGIGGGLRGGRPRRHKSDGRNKHQKTKDTDTQSFVPNSGRPSPSGPAVCGPSTQPVLFESSTDAYYPLNQNGASLLNNSNAEGTMRSHSETTAQTYSRYLTELHPDSTSSSSAATKLTPFENSEASPAASGSSSLASMGLMASSLTQPNANIPDGPMEFHRGIITPQFEIPGKLPCGLDRRFPLHHSPNGPYQHSYIPGPMSGIPSQETQYRTNSPTLNFVNYRITSHQRRIDRQHCLERMNLTRPLAANTMGPMCIYCMGDDRMNRQFARPEGLLRCGHCKYWAHFSCLRLPQRVVESAMRYHWQCIECKTCWLCGTPDHSDRMVLCADCDRAFHVGCLPTPLVRVLDSNWVCDICLHERYAASVSSSSKLDSDKYQTNLTSTDSTTGSNQS